jgi:hypothetical protein
MRKNMSISDRRLRSMLVAPVAVVLGIVIGPGSIAAIILYVVAVIMLGTGAAGSCPAYSVLHFDSRGRRRFSH